MEKRLIDDIPTFCLSLKRTKERTEYAIKLFEKQGLNVRIFYGMDCNDLNVDDFNLYETVNPNRTNWKIRSGVIGGSWSHILLWNTIWRLGHEQAIILEDDVEFVDGFKEKFELSYKELPSDWEMFYLGANDWPWGTGEKVKYSPHLLTYRPVCLHAYMVRKHMLKTMIQLASISFIDIDFCLIGELPHLKTYVADPILITEKSYNAGNRAKDGIWRSISNPNFL